MFVCLHVHRGNYAGFVHICIYTMLCARIQIRKSFVYGRAITHTHTFIHIHMYNMYVYGRLCMVWCVYMCVNRCLRENASEMTALLCKRGRMHIQYGLYMSLYMYIYIYICIIHIYIHIHTHTYIYIPYVWIYKYCKRESA
jgi:hypothetical protein